MFICPKCITMNRFRLVNLAPAYGVPVWSPGFSRWDVGKHHDSENSPPASQSAKLHRLKPAEAGTPYRHSSAGARLGRTVPNRLLCRRALSAHLVAAFFQFAPRRQDDMLLLDRLSHLRVDHRFQILEAKTARPGDKREIVRRPRAVDNYHGDTWLEVLEHGDESRRLGSLFPFVTGRVQVIDDRQPGLPYAFNPFLDLLHGLGVLGPGKTAVTADGKDRDLFLDAHFNIA